MTIVVAGGSGFIGIQLCESLLKDGHTIVIVDKKAPLLTHSELFFIQCDVAKQPLPYNILEHTDAVINLVGEPILGKWTKEKMSLIKESRINSTNHIVESIKNTKSRPSVFICASAIGFYGDTGNTDAVDEQGVVGSDYLAEVTSQWEASARAAIEHGVRVVCVRTSQVLGNGGILKQLLRTAPFGFLMKPTKQNPWFSWIHSADIVNVYKFALETTTLQGVVNAVAPTTTHLNDVITLLSKLKHRPIIGTVPSWILRARYGALLEEFSKNSQVTPRRLLDKGFVFQYQTIEEALSAIIINTK